MARDWTTGTFGLHGAPERLHPMIVGYEPIPESLSLLGGDPARFLLEPVTAAAAVYADGAWVLLDSGFNIDAVRDHERRFEAYGQHDSYTPVVPPGDPLAEAVRAGGLEWDRLAGVAISHVHFDHTGGLRLVSPHVPVVLQRAEWDYGSTQAGPGDAVLVEDFTRTGLDIVLADGDTELAPGLWALDTAGHTPGHQSFAVELSTSTIVLACDAADLRANITGRVPCGSTMRPEDAVLAERAIRRLHELDQRTGTQVWPGHDPEWAPWRGE